MKFKINNNHEKMYEVEFITPDGSELILNLYEDEDKIKQAMKPYLLKNYLELLLKNYPYEDICLLYNNGENVDVKRLEKIVWKQDNPKYECIRVDKICPACRDGVANQLGHMEPGCCLYNAECF